MVNNNKCNNPFNWSSLFTIFFRLDLKGKSVQEEPKGKVFLSKLILLFQFCHLCLFPNPKVAVTQTGTMLSIVTECSKCGEKPTWSDGEVSSWKSITELCCSVLKRLSEMCSWCFSTWVCWLFMSRRTIITWDVSSYHLLRHSGKNIKTNYWNILRNKDVRYWLEMDLTIVWATQPNTRHLHNVLLYYRTHHPFSPCAS